MGADLLHSAQESSPRERFIWTSSGGIDFRIEVPLASEPDLMAVVAKGGRREGWVDWGRGLSETGMDGMDRVYMYHHRWDTARPSYRRRRRCDW